MWNVNQTCVLLRSLSQFRGGNYNMWAERGEYAGSWRDRRILWGIIDEDPFSVQPPYISKLKMALIGISRILTFIYYMIVLRNDLIVLRPRLEEWILNAAKESNIHSKKYNLPTDPVGFYKRVSFNLRGFERMIDDLLVVGSERILALRRILLDLFKRITLSLNY